MLSLLRQIIRLLPGVSRVPRHKQSVLLIFSSRGVKSVIVGRIDCKCIDRAERIWICNRSFIRMVRVHTDALNRRGLGINQLPSLTRIRTAPQIPRSRKYRLRIAGIESEKVNDFAEVKHPPTPAAVVRYI